MPNKTGPHKEDSFRVTLIVRPAGSGVHPDDWFWTDACRSPDDEVIVEHVDVAYDV